MDESGRPPNIGLLAAASAFKISARRTQSHDLSDSAVSERKIITNGDVYRLFKLYKEKGSTFVVMKLREWFGFEIASNDLAIYTKMKRVYVTATNKLKTCGKKTRFFKKAFDIPATMNNLAKCTSQENATGKEAWKRQQVRNMKINEYKTASSTQDGDLLHDKVKAKGNCLFMSKLHTTLA